MANIIVPASTGRSDFMRVSEALASQFGISQADLIARYKIYNDVLKMPQLLVPSTSAYSFNPVKAVDTPVPGENKIDKNDFFAITGVGIRFTRATYSSVNGTLSNYGNSKEYTYPYASVFTGTNGSLATEANCLQTIVRGGVALTVTNDQQWGLPCSELVFEDQNFSSPGTSVQYGGNGNTSRGVFELDSIIIIDGGADNLLLLNLLQGDTAIIDGSKDASANPTLYRNLIMPVLYGIHIKNVAGGGYSLQNCRVS